MYIYNSAWHIKLNFQDVIGNFDSYAAQCQLFYSQVFQSL